MLVQVVQTNIPDVHKACPCVLREMWRWMDACILVSYARACQRVAVNFTLDQGWLAALKWPFTALVISIDEDAEKGKN